MGCNLTEITEKETDRDKEGPFIKQDDRVCVCVRASEGMCVGVVGERTKETAIDTVTM